MDLSFLDTRTLFLIGHLLGVAFGAGGAFLSDLLFLKAVRDNKISKTEFGFIELGGWCVSIGLGILLVSGALLFSLDPEKYLASSKFLVKMTVVLLLIINGFLLHMIHIPRLKKRIGQALTTPRGKMWKLALIGSGVLSVVSWMTALALGAIKSIPYPYENVFIVYLAVLLFALGFAYLLRDILVPSTKSKR